MTVYQPKYRDKKTGQLVESDVYWCDFTYRKRRIRESTGQTKLTLAREYEKNLRKKLENAKAGVAEEKSDDRLRTLTALLAERIKVWTTGRKADTESYVQDRCEHLKRLLGGRLIYEITEAAVAGYVTTRLAEGAAAGSINREVAYLARALGIDRDSVWPHLARLKPTTDPIGKALSEAEQAALLAAARANRSKYALPFIAAAMYTGFRATEIRTLRWRQVDFIDGWIRSELSKTKAGEFREVLLLPELRDALLQHRAWLEKRLGVPPEPAHHVFPGANRGMPVDPSRPVTNIASAWYTIRQAAGVHCRLHDLRHTFATRLVEAGVSDAIVRELIGHVDPQVIQRYTHIRRGAKQDATERAFSRQSDAGSKEHVKESPKVSVNTVRH